jgi:organic hydroperoxide reductase OsmC/OhrA
MKISAVVRNTSHAHEAIVSTDAAGRTLDIPPRAGRGSSVNGGELLLLALATCYCNDLYREAARLCIDIDSVEVEANADFDRIGGSAGNVWYRARVVSPAPQAAIAELLRQTDAVAEVQNTLRAGTRVSLRDWDDPLPDPSAGRSTVSTRRQGGST